MSRSTSSTVVAGYRTQFLFNGILVTGKTKVQRTLLMTRDQYYRCLLHELFNLSFFSDHGHEWLFNQEILKNANDVVLNVS